MNQVRVRLIHQIREYALPIPPDVTSALSPALFCLYEWYNHWLDLPGVQRLRVGQEWCEPVKGTLFNLRFENRLGLARIQPYTDGRPLCQTVTVESISRKFSTPREHIAFFENLLEDLFARSVRLPFDLESPTERGVKAALQPPTPLFLLHFLSQYASALRDGIALIQKRPYRCLTAKNDLVGLAQASQADAEVLQDIVRSPERWAKTERDILLARHMKGYAPTRLRQHLSIESLDTPENRFVRHFLRQLLVAAEKLLRQPWWDKVPSDRQERVRSITEWIRRAYHHPMFDDVGPMRYLPLSSQVLLRRDGYRALLGLWRHFQRARRPLFGPLQEAIEVRDIATLYEVWVFFALIDRIALALEKTPEVEVHTSVYHGLTWKAKARFPGAGTLVYNLGFRRPNSYSVSLRPDFSWMQGGEPKVVLDAKFRLERLPSSDEEDSPPNTAKRADLYKMHTYRDALGSVRAAVAIYPGSETLFYTKVPGVSRAITLEELLIGDISGIGAFPMKPIK